MKTNEVVDQGDDHWDGLERIDWDLNISSILQLIIYK